MNPSEQRAEAVRSNPRQVPNGAGRLQPFKAELRSETVIWNEQERMKVEGYASIVGKRYQMWDMFGPYDEVVDPGAFDETLSKNPDVAFLVNHKGVSMARSTNGSLELSVDGKGLKSVAYLNPKRQDVQDLVVAIEDRDVTEMSFAFRIFEGGGEWNDEFTEFRILKADLDRGDVSAVNYGANPYTSIAARSTEILEELDKLPEGARRAALERLTRTSETVKEERDETPAEKQAPKPGEKLGRSVRLVELMLDT